MDMTIRFDKKTVLITGGSSGIGFACAELFGSLGARVGICGTNMGKLQRAEKKLSEQGITVFAKQCSVADTNQLKEFSLAVEKALGPIDIWVSNAGVYPQASIIDTDEELFDRTFATNVKSVYAGAKIAFESMKDRGGVMLIASSFASVLPSVGSGIYAASKSAVTSMIKTLAAELAPYDIRVNGYIPGVIDTDMTHELTVMNTETMQNSIALRKFGEPMDVAWTAAFLASDYARYITGATLEVTGGKLGVQNPQKAWSDKKSRK